MLFCCFIRHHKLFTEDVLQQLTSVFRADYLHTVCDRLMNGSRSGILPGCDAVGCCNAAAMLAAMRWPLEVASSCMWLPAPAANDRGIEISCCNPLPTDTGMRRCWTGMAAEPAEPLAVEVDADGGPLAPVASSSCGEWPWLCPEPGPGLDSGATTGLNTSASTIYYRQ